ncbi:MAG: hypothetical protein ACREMV_02540, partial [Gemmatimonadales bacterium]
DGAVHTVGVALAGHLSRGRRRAGHVPRRIGLPPRVGLRVETGLKFRVNVSHTPVKFLTFLTDYWGFRAGIKNRGFFDIDRLTYVLEFGAGSV